MIYEEHYGTPLEPSSIGVLQRIVRPSDHAQIPLNTKNMDYVEYLAWKKAGGIPTIVNDYVAPDAPAVVTKVADAKNAEDAVKKLNEVMAVLREKGLIT